MLFRSTGSTCKNLFRGLGATPLRAYPNRLIYWPSGEMRRGTTKQGTKSRSSRSTRACKTRQEDSRFQIILPGAQKLDPVTLKPPATTAIRIGWTCALQALSPGDDQRICVPGAGDIMACDECPSVVHQQSLPGHSPQLRLQRSEAEWTSRRTSHSRPLDLWSAVAVDACRRACPQMGLLQKLFFPG